MPFQYQPLPPGSKTFRVLELHPSARKRDAVVCSLQQCSFPPEDGASYEPLSYCWGEAKDKSAITLNDSSVEVTKSLYAVLVRLRLENETRRLWVDAICINQSDNAEKAAQVQRMRDIYQQGSRTIVWLGTGSLSATRGFSVIPKLIESAIADAERSNLGEVELSSRYSPRLSQFLQILELPYFTRIWVVQEVAVSQFVEVLCGNHSISWDSLTDAVSMSSSIRTDSYQGERSLALFWSISDARTRFQAKLKQSLLQLLLSHRRTFATCLKDKVYALLGLVDSGHLLNHHITVNYRDEYTTSDAYVDVACSILGETNDLDLLSTPGTLQSDAITSTLPTWVPDWSKPPRSFTFAIFSEPRRFAAPGTSTSHPIFRNDRKQVCLHGYIFDEVGHIGHAAADRPAPLTSTEQTNMFRHQFSSNIQYWGFETQNLRAWKNWFHMICSQPSRTYVTGEDIRDAFWKTFMGDCPTEDGEDIAAYRRDCEAIVGSARGPTGLFDRSAFWTAYCITANLATSYKDQMNKSKVLLRSDTPFMATYGRRMFTSKDQYIGLGPRDMCAGDSLAFLEGGQVAYVLRRKGDTYEFVGDCYVHGVMRGERFEKDRCERIWLA
ncbi:hypothetical protein G7046_g1808 [Stylonectria norvegica]|nr:hypothetical protein G7046_g1808 [Stylonectria norvegica]